jgi:hypothetical protein
MFRTILAVFAILLLAAPPVRAEPKPQKECAAFGKGSFEARADLVRDAPTCDAAMEEFEACAYGAGGDTGLGQIARKKCEADFLPRLSKSRRAAYNAEIDRCNQKYRNEDGTMYRSFESFCRAGVAQTYSRRAKKTGARR